MAGGLLSLKWNNHAATFLGLLENLHYKDNFSDASLACEGKIYPVHKFVLSVCSDYFKSIFESTPQWKQSVVVLKDISCSEVEALLSYMYIGEVNVVQDKLPGLLKAAECLKVKGLAVADENCKTRKNVSEIYPSVSLPSTSNVVKQTASSANSRNVREKRPHSTSASQQSPSQLPPLKKNRRSDLVVDPVGSQNVSSIEVQQIPSSNSLNSSYSSNDNVFNGENRKKAPRKTGSTVNGTKNNMTREMKFEECIADEVVTVKPEPVDPSNQLPEVQPITQTWSDEGQQMMPSSTAEPSSSRSACVPATSHPEQLVNTNSPAARGNRDSFQKPLSAASLLDDDEDCVPLDESLARIRYCPNTYDEDIHSYDTGNYSFLDAASGGDAATANSLNASQIFNLESHHGALANDPLSSAAFLNLPPEGRDGMGSADDESWYLPSRRNVRFTDQQKEEIALFCKKYGPTKAAQKLTVLYGRQVHKSTVHYAYKNYLRSHPDEAASNSLAQSEWTL